MESRLTYMDMERLVNRARLQGQDAVAFHLAMARDVLLEEEFGRMFFMLPARIERLVADQLTQADPPSSSDSTP